MPLLMEALKKCSFVFGLCPSAVFYQLCHLSLVIPVLSLAIPGLSLAILGLSLLVPSQF